MTAKSIAQEVTDRILDQGRWWFQGEAAPGNGTVTVTLRNEVQHG